MRVSDADRQRAVEELRRHCAAGRIDVDEYASRIERALAATTLEELDDLRADLPMLRIAEPGGHRIWAGPAPWSKARPLKALSSGPYDGATDAGRITPAGRLTAVAVAVITVAVVLAAIVVSLVAEWAWAVLLLAGWAAGLLQGRLRRAGRGGP
jgi:hypothetical protein